MSAKPALIALLLGGAAAAAAPASAALVFTCTVAATPIAFGTFNPLSGSAVAAAGSVTVTCSATGSGSATVSGTLSLSTGSSGRFATRTMRSGTNVLDYNIYLTPAYTQIIGDGTSGTIAPSESGTVTAGQIYQAGITTYGLIPASQNVAPGSYVDTIVVTVTY